MARVTPFQLDHMVNLTNMYWNWNHQEEAIEMMKVIKETRLRTLRPNHSDTINSLSTLENWQDIYQTNKQAKKVKLTVE